MIVKFVETPGEELYGIEDISDADPLPLLKTNDRSDAAKTLDNIFGF